MLAVQGYKASVLVVWGYKNLAGIQENGLLFVIDTIFMTNMTSNYGGELDHTVVFPLERQIIYPVKPMCLEDGGIII